MPNAAPRGTKAAPAGEADRLTLAAMCGNPDRAQPAYVARRYRRQSGSDGTAMPSENANRAAEAQVSRGQDHHGGGIGRQMAIKATEAHQVLMNIGIMATINQPIWMEFGRAGDRVAKLQRRSICGDRCGLPVPRPHRVLIMDHVICGYNAGHPSLQRSLPAVTSHHQVQTPKWIFPGYPGSCGVRRLRARGAKVLVSGRGRRRHAITIEAINVMRA